MNQNCSVFKRSVSTIKETLKYNLNSAKTEIILKLNDD